MDDSTADVAFLRVDELEVVALLDARAEFPEQPDAVFPDATDADWAAAGRLDPGCGDRSAWTLSFRSFALRRPHGGVTLVDLGVGPPGGPASSWLDVEGRLPATLAAAEIAIAEVDTVVLTHLHSDHVGWTVSPESGEPLFPGASYVVQGAEVSALPTSSRVWSYAVDPLVRGGLLRQVEGRTRLWAGGGTSVELLPTPGHTPGHQSVLVTGRSGTVAITGDVVVHPLQVANPAVSYRHEHDHETARASRRVVLDVAGHPTGWLATAHLGVPFLRCSA